MNATDKQPVNQSIIEADRPITVTVLPVDVCDGMRCDSHNCVMANAFKRHPLLKRLLDDVAIGYKKTKLYLNDGTEMHLSTPTELADVIRQWDGESGWRLPMGEYTFGVIIHDEYTPEERAKRAEQDKKRREARKISKEFTGKVRSIK